MVRREMGEKLARINWNGLVDGERPRKSEMVHGVVLVLDGPAIQGQIRSYSQGNCSRSSAKSLAMGPQPIARGLEMFIIV